MPELTYYFLPVIRYCCERITAITASKDDNGYGFSGRKSHEPVSNLKGAIMKKVYPSKAARVAVTGRLLMAFMLTGSVCAAMQADIPRISIQELKAMMDKGTKVTIIDAQPRDIYEEGHIKGAISIPWKSQIALEDVWSIPSDALIVTYCDCGPGEADSADVASQLMQMGYEDVKVLKDPSIKGWKKAGYPIEK